MFIMLMLISRVSKTHLCKSWPKAERTPKETAENLLSPLICEFPPMKMVSTHSRNLISPSLIIHLPLLRIIQTTVRAVNFLKRVTCTRGLVFIWVQFQCQLPKPYLSIRLLQIIFSSILSDTKYLVEIRNPTDFLGKFFLLFRVIASIWFPFLGLRGPMSLSWRRGGPLRIPFYSLLNHLNPILRLWGWVHLVTFKEHLVGLLQVPILQRPFSDLDTTFCLLLIHFYY